MYYKVVPAPLWHNSCLLQPHWTSSTESCSILLYDDCNSQVGTTLYSKKYDNVIIATTYSWLDKAGRTHFLDSLSKLLPIATSLCIFKYVGWTIEKLWISDTINIEIGLDYLPVLGFFPRSGTCLLLIFSSSFNKTTSWSSGSQL